MIANNRLKSNVVAIIQARMTSKRLPEKCMRELAGKPMIDHIMERAKAIKGVSTVVLALPEDSVNDVLAERAKNAGVDVFRGSETNVLSRYYFCAKEKEADYVVRITADNPLTDPVYAAMVIEIATEAGVDLSSTSNLPIGTAVEVIKFSALEQAYCYSDLPYHLEHVTPYIKEHPELFTIERHDVDLEKKSSNLRLTVDTEEDFAVMKKIYDELYKGEIISLNDVISFLNNNPSVAEINSSIKQRQMNHAEK